jgi:hypothetical protein
MRQLAQKRNSHSVRPHTVLHTNSGVLGMVRRIRARERALPLLRPARASSSWRVVVVTAVMRQVPVEQPVKFQ